MFIGCSKIVLFFVNNDYSSAENKITAFDLNTSGLMACSTQSQKEINIFN